MTKQNIYTFLGIEKHTLLDENGLDFAGSVQDYAFCFCVGRPHALTKTMHPDAREWVRCPFLDLDAEHQAYYVCHEKSTFYVIYTRTARETIEDLLKKK